MGVLLPLISVYVRADDQSRLESVPGARVQEVLLDQDCMRNFRKEQSELDHSVNRPENDRRL